MMSRNFPLIAIATLFLAVQVCMAAYYFVLRRRKTQAKWETLLAKLIWMDREHIDRIALALIEGSEEPSDGLEPAGLESSQLWSLIGGLEGLKILEKNSAVIIELASYMQQWYPEALVIAERLRLDARELQWHVSRLKGAEQNGNLQVSFPFYAQRAVVAYYRMTHRLLELYRAGNFDMLADLQRAL
jgi:hypothetical protein